MDDMYQYAASAVNSNNKEQTVSQVSEEDDVIIKAFNNLGWGKKWSGWMDTVKKQSEALVEGTKRDLQEIAQVLTEDAEDNDAENSREIEASVNEHTALDTIRENLGNINTMNFTSLRDGLVHTLNQTLPSQITSVRLPENMDLTQLKEGLATGTRSAEHYLQQFGSDVISALKKTVTVLAPEDEEQERRGESSTSTIDNNIKSSPRIYATRKDGLIAKMQMDENTYLKEPGFSKAHYEQEKKIFETFNASFSIEEYTEEIAQLLNDYQGLRDMMDKLVPLQVSYTLFWQRYFYHAWKIEQDEQKRQLIVKQQQEEAEADFKWDSDDEDNMTTNDVNESNEIADKTSVKEEEGNARTSTTSNHTEDTDDFSNISSTSTSPPLKSSAQTEDDWVKAEKKKSDEEDSDSDWE